MLWYLTEDFNELAIPMRKKGGKSFNKYERINSFLATTSAESIHVNDKLFKWKKKESTHISSMKDWIEQLVGNTNLPSIQILLRCMVTSHALIIVILFSLTLTQLLV